MSPESAHAIDAALGALSLDERLVALICSIVTRKQQQGAIISLLAVLGALANGLSAEQRVVLAELTRDVADEIEQRRQVVPINVA